MLDFFYCTAFITLHSTTLHCTAGYCKVWHTVAFHCISLHCFTAPSFTAPSYTKPWFTALHWTALDCTALHFTALHCTALHCTALHCTALYCTTLRWDRNASAWGHQATTARLLKSCWTQWAQCMAVFVVGVLQILDGVMIKSRVILIYFEDWTVYKVD